MNSPDMSIDYLIKCHVGSFVVPTNLEITLHWDKMGHVKSWGININIEKMTLSLCHSEVTPIYSETIEYILQAWPSKNFLSSLGAAAFPNLSDQISWNRIVRFLAEILRAGMGFKQSITKPEASWSYLRKKSTRFLIIGDSDSTMVSGMLVSQACW